MEITNEKIFSKIERNRRIVMLLLVLIVALAFIIKNIPVWAIISVSVFALAAILYFIRQWIYKLAYFSFKQEGDLLVFKNYITGDFSFKRIKIAIPAASFWSYTYRVKGLKHELILKEEISDRVATYLPVSLSLLAEPQKQALFKILDSLAIGNEQ